MSTVKKIAQPAKNRVSSGDETNGVKPRILYVDDSQLMRATAIRMFRDNYDLLLAEDGAEGWKILNADPSIQVVFSDVVMPEMDGFELLRRIRTSENADIRSLPVIMATDMDRSESAREIAFELGATDFLPKPFVVADVRSRARIHSDYRRNTQRLEKNTTIDAATGLFNKRGIQAQMDRDLAFTQRHKENLTVIVIEFDTFKDLFVRIGRKGTDAVIAKVAKVLLGAVRKEDSVARVGLATFMVCMPSVKDECSLELAQRICKIVESFKARLDNVIIPITVSVGVCSLGKREEGSEEIDLKTLWNGAQHALKKASEQGRSQIVHLHIADYIAQCSADENRNVSIDELVGLATEGDYEQVLPHLDGALDKLVPLFILLSNEQRQKIITCR